jgi:hypothetical protein
LFFIGTIEQFRATIELFAQTVMVFIGAIEVFERTIEVFARTVMVFVGTIELFGAAIELFIGTIAHEALIIQGLIGTIENVGAIRASRCDCIPPVNGIPG